MSEPFDFAHQPAIPRRQPLLPGRLPGRVVVAALATVLLLVAAGFSPAATRAATVKAVFIVGPTGSMTAMLRDQAERAARIAEAAGAEVVRAYSPNATWPVVKQALSGASIVVYLGHGYGFPSPYRSALYPPSHDGFGLNPIAGGGDDAHQYFGESYVDDVVLAPNAIVLLHHLCYASGDSETGDPEPTVEVAVQRVDNFAAGFLRAGAAAVIAEAYMGPAYYVDALMNSASTIDGIWQASPRAHGNEFAVASTRSPGFTARLDPDRQGAGYNRSIVSRGSLSATSVRDSAMGSTVPTTPQVPVEPSLTDLGLAFGEMALESRPIAGAPTRVTIPVLGGAPAQLPSGIHLGLRWDPIMIEVSAQQGLIGEPTPGPTPESASPMPSAYVPPEIDLVVPEALGAVVELSPARYRAKSLVASTQYPAEAGLYRLVPSLHNDELTAYDPQTQALLAPVLVRVAGAVSVAYGAPSTLELATSAPGMLSLRLANTGSEAWDLAAPSEPPSGDQPTVEPEALPAHLVAVWVSTVGAPVPPPATLVLSAEASTPGSDEVVEIPIWAPTEPGSYLLLIDVTSPAHGPLSALGVGPAVVRVTVVPGEPPAAVPDLLLGAQHAEDAGPLSE